MAAVGAGALEARCPMIDKREILEAASALSLLPNVVEKDYVLGWLLAGIHAHPELVDSWVFKGGTCLKKCFFETYRFSEDLDFTLRDEGQIEEGFLKRVLGEVIAWVADESGLVLPNDQLSFDIYKNPRVRVSCQGKVGYRGPVSPASSAGGWPKIKLDLTADERLVLPAVQREVFHPYTDRPEGGFSINSYAYEEAFGEKVRALGERTRPRDLYDVVNLYRHGDSRPLSSILCDVLGQKCAAITSVSTRLFGFRTTAPTSTAAPGTPARHARAGRGNGFSATCLRPRAARYGGRPAGWARRPRRRPRDARWPR